MNPSITTTIGRAIFDASLRHNGCTTARCWCKFMNLTGWVVVFDLDDTLISSMTTSVLESQQLASIASLYGVSFEGRIQAALNNGVKDTWGWACEPKSPN